MDCDYGTLIMTRTCLCQYHSSGEKRTDKRGIEEEETIMTHPPGSGEGMSDSTKPPGSSLGHSSQLAENGGFGSKVWEGEQCVQFCFVFF